MAQPLRDHKFARALGANIARIRTLADLSQGEVGLRAELHPTSIGLIERGERTPSARSLFVLAHALEVEVGELFSGMTWQEPIRRTGRFEIASDHFEEE
jgi:transcriptional regulator with XRE-family HTH domain